MYASNQTTNYDLSQWLPTDTVHHEDFNGDNAKLDAALAAKADAADLSSLTQTVSTLSATVGGHTTALTGKGNCQIYYSIYTGTGSSGSGAPIRITFSAKPILVFIVDSSNDVTMRMVQGVTQAQASNSFDWAAVSWSGNILGWYADNAAAQMNKSGTKYYIIALLKCG